MTTARLMLVVPSATSFHAFLRQVAVAWQDLGGRVAVATAEELPGTASQDWPPGVERLPLPALRNGSPWGLAVAARSLGRHVRIWRPELVHAHFTAAALVTAMARVPKDVLKLATFHGLHASSETGSSSLIVRAAELLAIRRMDHTWVLNAEDETWLRNRALGERVSRLPCCGVGCELTRFDPGRFSAADRRRTRELLGIPMDAEVVAFIGRRTAFKGFDTTVRAFRMIRSARPTARLLLVGAEDPLHATGLSAAEREYLRNDSTVVDLGWRNDVSTALSIATIVVFPSTREGMPVNLMEALAMGVPVVSSRVRGCHDIVEDGKTGVLVPRPTADDVAKAAVQLLADRSLREAMARNALGSRQRFDRRAFVTAQLDAYHSLLRPSPPRCR